MAESRDSALSPEAIDSEEPTVTGASSGVITRRTILAGAAWAVPAVSVIAATPAMAASPSGLTLSAPNMQVPAAGAVPVTALFKNSSGQPVPGASVSFAGPSGSSFSPVSATTDGSGSAVSQFDLKTPWATPGASVPVTATAAAGSGSAAFTVLGSNLAVAGRAYTASVGQSELVFPSPVIEAIAGSADPNDKAFPWWFLVLLADGTVWAKGGNPRGQLGDGTTTARANWAPIPGLAGVTQIAASAATGYAVLSDGSLKSWGMNANGEVGDGSTSDRLLPVQVSGLTSGVKQVVGGAGHAMALLSDGSVRAWGYNATGQVGDGSATNRLTPVQVSGLPSRVTQVGAAAFSSFVLSSDGAVLGWGYNNDGEVGDGTQTERRTPVQVAGLTSGVAQIAAQAYTGFALMSDGTVKGWGFSGGGEVGDGAVGVLRLTPVQLPGLSGVKQIATGLRFSYALLSDGSVKSWGINDEGQLGDGTTTDRSAPVAVVLPSGRVVERLAFASGGSKTALLITNANPLRLSVAAQIPATGAVTVKALLKDASGQGVSGETVSFAGPAGASFNPSSTTTDGSGEAGTQLDLGTPWAKPGSSVSLTVKAGSRTATATSTLLGSNLAVAGRAYSSSVGQSELVFPSPVVDAVAASADPQDEAFPWWFLVLLADGTVWTKGGNPHGQLGDGTTTNRAKWAPVPGLAGVTQIAAASASGYALLTDGSLKAWGKNPNGELGDGSTVDRLSPVSVSGLTSGVKQVVAGAGHALALLSDGSVRAWGYNETGQVGDGSATNRLTATPVTGLPSSVTQVGAAAFSSFVLLADGSVRGWGYNNDGEVGDGTQTERRTPVQVNGLTSGVTQIAAQAYTGFALLSDGTVKGWGFSGGGEVGDGAVGVLRLTPVQLPGLSGVKQIATGLRFSYALLSDGSVKSWGINDEGQLGDGTTTDRSAPVAVALPAGRVVNRMATCSTGSKTTLLTLKTD